MNDNIAPTSPPDLPDFIFLLSDHESRQLACDVAQKLYELNSTILVFDFLTPIHEGLATMRGIEWDIDLGALPADAPTHDELVSLEKWYNEQYGEEALGIAAYVEAQETRLTNASSIVYRDATWPHLKAFLPHLKPHQFIVVDLLSLRAAVEENVGDRILRFASPTVDSVTASIVEASR